MALARSEPHVLTPESPPNAENDRGPFDCHMPRPILPASSTVVVPPRGPIYGLTWSQSDRILSLFRERYIRNFPFLVLDDHITANQLYIDKPFLFRVIMLAAAPLPIPRIIKMKRNVLAYLGQHMLVEEERQLDLLQGLLICISW